MPFSRRRDLDAARTRARLAAVCPGTALAERREALPGEWLVEPAGPPGPPVPLTAARGTPSAGPPRYEGPDVPSSWLPHGGRGASSRRSGDAALGAAHAESPAPGPGGAARRLLSVLSVRTLADPGRRGVAALAVVAVLACLVAGWSAWRARPRAEPVDAVRISAEPLAGSGSPSPATDVVVAVAGGVRRPGLVRLPLGARVADAVAAAGGIRPGTQLGSLNLARRLVDGELVTVGAVAVPPGTAAPPGTGGARGALLDLNTATVAELDSLPGVGPVLAQRIVDFRTEHGPFATVDQLREVDGIGESRFGELRGRVTV
jgi:competence protein ComEA